MKMQGVNYAHGKFSFRIGCLFFCGSVRLDDVRPSVVPYSLALLFHRTLLRSALLTQRSTDRMLYRSRCHDGKISPSSSQTTTGMIFFSSIETENAHELFVCQIAFRIKIY